MTERSPLKPHQTAIADTAKYLTEAAGSNLYWASLTLGRASLKIVEPVAGTAGVYELKHIGLLDPDTNTHHASCYIFYARGIILGILNSEIDPTNSNMKEVEAGMVFQVENGLFAPGEEDYEQLARVFLSGTKDAPIIRADVNEQ